MRTVQSSLPEAKNWPVGSKDTERTRLECPRYSMPITVGNGRSSSRCGSLGRKFSGSTTRFCSIRHKRKQYSNTHTQFVVGGSGGGGGTNPGVGLARDQVEIEAPLESLVDETRVGRHLL
jgi:hypothetical protein